MQQPVLWSRGPQLLKPLRLDPEITEAAAMRSPQLEKAAPTRYNWRKPVCSMEDPAQSKRKRIKERKKEKEWRPLLGRTENQGIYSFWGCGVWGGGVSEIFPKVQIFGTRLGELTVRQRCV